MIEQIELRKVTKVFGSLVANSEVDFTIKAGRIYGLIGTACMNQMAEKFSLTGNR